MYRIIQKGDLFQVQKKVLFFWTKCYVYYPDYSRSLAVYSSYNEALSYMNLKNFLED